MADSGSSESVDHRIRFNVEVQCDILHAYVPEDQGLATATKVTATEVRSESMTVGYDVERNLKGTGYAQLCTVE